MTVPVLLPLALPAPYDYAVPEGMTVREGQFVVAPLSTVDYLGVVWPRDESAEPPKLDPKKLREIIEVVDDVPPLPRVSLDFADWVARYTLSSPGMVLRMMMSAGRAFSPPAPRYGVRLLEGSAPSRMTPARARVLEVAGNGMTWAKSALAEAAGVSTGVIDGLVDAGTLITEELPAWAPPQLDLSTARARLTPEQADAAGELLANMKDGFSVTLLDGVTGSGKTEVYFEAIAATLAQGQAGARAHAGDRAHQSFHRPLRAALRRQARRMAFGPLGAACAAACGGRSPRTRRSSWSAPARRCSCPSPISASSSSMRSMTQATSRRSASPIRRATWRSCVGRLGQFPVVLSSATPSIESLVNAAQGRYRHIKLEQRYKAARLPDIAAIDMRASPPERGKWLSPVLVEAVAETLARGEQALLFLNRRGYAPVTVCRNCGFKFECPNCSAWLVEHRFRRRLECHHCGTFAPIPEVCPNCGAEHSLVPCGPGIERIDEEVAALFPEARRVLLSSDLTPGVSDLRETLREIEDREVDIVIGTQLVAKGHHFPGLALVGVVDADLGLTHADPRAAERTFQLLNQVTGRAGREVIPGRGLIQTYMPEHPVIQALASGDRDAFLAREIEARKAATMPPFGRLASLLVSAGARDAAESYARSLARAAPAAQKIEVLGPAEAPLAVIRGRFRFRLLVKAAREADLQAYLRLWLKEAPKPKGDVRLNVDIDPYSFL